MTDLPLVQANSMINVKHTVEDGDPCLTFQSNSQRETKERFHKFLKDFTAFVKGTNLNKVFATENYFGK